MSLLRLRNNHTVHGILKDFDVHMNLTLENAEDVSDEKPVKLGTVLLRGDNILAISLPEEDEESFSSNIKFNFKIIL